MSILARLLLVAAAAGCTTLHAQTVPTVPNGRLLASNCFQCHGTDGRGPGFERLSGESASEIYSELKEFQARGARGLMGAHALGYTDAQLRAIADWFATQR